MRASLFIIALLLSACLDQQPGQGWQSEKSDYKSIRPLFWSEVYANGGNTLYCDEPFGSKRGREINVEHVFPMSWVTKSLKCGDRDQCRRNSDRFNQIEADMHNLYPARSEINYARSSMAFGILDGENHFEKGCDFEIDKRKYRAEPRPAVRGEIARAMLYMADSYPELKLFRRQKELMLKWHRNDPPDAEEIARNRIIQQQQGTANHYIQ